jgi:putative oxidoreductase
VNEPSTASARSSTDRPGSEDPPAMARLPTDEFHRAPRSYPRQRARATQEEPMATYPAPTRSRVAHRALWTLQILLGLFIAVGSGAPKLWGDPFAVQIFTEIGAGEWFRYFIGVVEIAGGIGLMVARLAGPAAAGLMALMVGAAYTQAVVLDEPAMVITPAIIFVLAAVIAWGRRDTIAAWLPDRNR